MNSPIRNDLIRHSKNCRKILESSENAYSGFPLADVLDAEVIRTIADELGIEFRDRIFSPWVTVWTFLTQLLSADQSCRSAVSRLVAWLSQTQGKICSSGTGAYVQARTRLPESLFRRLGVLVGTRLHDSALSQDSWSFRGRAVKLVDGSTLTIPDTSENRVEYPHSISRKKKSAPGFPMVRILTLISFSTGALLDLKIGPYSGKGSGELSLFNKLIKDTEGLKKSDILLMDRLFCSYLVLASCVSRGMDFVVRMKGNMNPEKLPTLKRLGRGDRLVRFDRPSKHKTTSDWGLLKKLDESIVLREITYRLQVRGFRPKTIVLLTTFIDSKLYTSEEITDLYWTRWHCELDLRSIKSVMQMDCLKSKTPSMLRKEIWTYVLAYNLVRTVMAQSAILGCVKPRDISFKGTLQIINSFRPYLMSATDSEQWRRQYEAMLSCIAKQKLIHRPNRLEPRAIKKRKSSYQILHVSRSKAREMFWRKGDCHGKRKAELQAVRYGN